MKALLIILLVLIVIGLLPVGVDGGYNADGFKLYIRIGPLNIRAVPAGGLMSKLIKSKAKKPKKLMKKADLPHEEEKPKKPRMTKEYIITLIKLGLKALGRFRRKLTVDYLSIHLTIAADDPFKTAISYGAVTATFYSAIQLAEKIFNITERDFGVSCNYLADKTAVNFWITASIQIWEILYVAAITGIEFFKLKKKKECSFKKRAPIN